MKRKLLVFLIMINLLIVNKHIFTTNEQGYKLKMQDLVFMALNQNYQLKIKKIQIPLDNQKILLREDVFKNKVNASINYRGNRSDDKAVPLVSKVNSLNSEIQLQKRDHNGSSWIVTGNGGITDPDNEKNSATAGILVQYNTPLLEGKGKQVNLVEVEKAKNNVEISRYQLEGYTETLVSSVERACYDYALSQSRERILKESISLAQKNVDEIRERILVGMEAPSEMAASESELAVRTESWIQAKTQVERAKITLLRYLCEPDPFLFGLSLEVSGFPQNIEWQLNSPEFHVEEALLNRTELLEAELRLSNQELEIIKTKNGMLPKLDFQIQFGHSRNSERVSELINNQLKDNNEIRASLLWTPKGSQREDKRNYEISLYTEEQLKESLLNLKNTVKLDVMDSYLRVKSDFELIPASRLVLRNAEVQYEKEQEKYRQGRSTAYLLSKAGRDLLDARLGYEDRQYNYYRSLTDFYLMTGRLLEERGIVAGNRSRDTVIIEPSNVEKIQEDVIEYKVESEETENNISYSPLKFRKRVKDIFDSIKRAGE